MACINSVMCLRFEIWSLYGDEDLSHGPLCCDSIVMWFSGGNMVTKR